MPDSSSPSASQSDMRHHIRSASEAEARNDKEYLEADSAWFDAKHEAKLHPSSLGVPPAYLTSDRDVRDQLRERRDDAPCQAASQQIEKLAQTRPKAIRRACITAGKIFIARCLGGCQAQCEN